MIGKQISHYKVLEKLGEGGMGVVYKAEDTKLERTVALKFLPPHVAGNEEDEKRFVEEARAAAALDHPNICTVYEINEADGQQYIAMAFVEGRSLKDMLEERPLKIDDALKIAIQVAKGLSAAHEKGIIHRDVKSSNIMVTPGGRVKIMDFGLAHRVEKVRTVDEQSTLGTAAYSSPEQVAGGTVDQRTDIWSFGVTLYEMVTGQLPFRGDYEQALLYSILNEIPEPATGLRTGVPMELERIIDKALAKNRDDRYQHVEDMLFDLKTLQNELDPARSKTGPTTGTRPMYAQESSLFRKLRDRHVFQIVVVYLAAAWGAARLTSWLVDQFILSPHLVNMVTLTFLSLLPSVILLSFFRGAGGGRNRWTIPEKIGVPVNLLVSLTLLMLMFQGKDIGAATTTVAVEDEKGETIERIVPKSEFRKKVALYVFENADGDSTLEWLQYTVPLFMEYDLLQDQFVRVLSAFDPSSFNRLKNAGFTNWLDAPVALKRNLAKEYHMDYCVFGSVAKANDKYVIKYQLHSTKTDKQEAESTHEGVDFFGLIDEISVQLKKDMGVPAGHLEETADMAVSDMLTSSVAAARSFGLAQKVMTFDQNWQKSLDYYQASIKEDETQAYAYFNMYHLYTMTGQPEAAERALTAAMQHAYKLPERTQFVIRGNYYFAKQQPDKTFAVFKMMSELYPTDILAHQGLMQLYRYRNDPENAVAECEKILELDPYNHEFILTAGDLNVRMGNNDKALYYFKRYAELNPGDARSFVRLGGFYERMGDYDEARGNYEKALLIDPTRVTVLVNLAEVEHKQGNDTAASAKYEEARATARSDEDRVRIFSSMTEFFRTKGQIGKALEHWVLELKAGAPSQTPMEQELSKMDDVELYVLAGEPERAFEIMDEIKAKVGPPFDKAVYLGYVSIYNEMGKPEEAQEALGHFEEYIKAYNLEVLRPMFYRMQGRIEELRGEYDNAILSYKQQIQSAPSERQANMSVGRCYRNLGDFANAEENLLEMLKVYPFDPEANYEIALVYDAAGKKSKAVEHLEKALAVWSDADEGYEPARKARDTMARWKSAPSSL